MAEMMSLRQMSLFMLIAFCVFSALMFVFHENHISMVGSSAQSNKFFHRLGVMFASMEEKVVDSFVSFEEAVVHEFVSDNKEMDDEESAYDDATASKMEEVKPSSPSTSGSSKGSDAGAPLLRGSSNANPILTPANQVKTNKPKPKGGRDGAIHLLEGSALRDLGKRTRRAADVYKDISASEDDFDDEWVSITTGGGHGTEKVLTVLEKPHATKRGKKKV